MKKLKMPMLMASMLMTMESEYIEYEEDDQD
jgi:hypothetical protein